VNFESLEGKRGVSVEGDTVVKIQEPRASRKERLRTEAGREVGRQTGLFRVPEIVAFDDSRGQIVFERLQLTGIRECLSEAGRSMDLAGRAAGVLAAIHSRMAPSDGTGKGTSPAVGIGLTRRTVPLHGDFGMRNIFCIRDSDDLVVIDWASADWMGVDADLGAPELDVAVFLISFFHRRLFGPWPIAHRHEVARRFLRTYAAESPRGLDVDTLRSVVSATQPGFNQGTRRGKGYLRALAYRPSMIDLGFFLRRLTEQDVAGQPERQRG
jgi:hypothetical protein